MKQKLSEALATIVLYSMLAWMFIYWLLVHSWRSSDDDS